MELTRGLRTDGRIEADGRLRHTTRVTTAQSANASPARAETDSNIQIAGLCLFKKKIVNEWIYKLKEDLPRIVSYPAWYLSLFSNNRH